MASLLRDHFNISSSRLGGWVVSKEPNFDENDEEVGGWFEKTKFVMSFDEFCLLGHF